MAKNKNYAQSLKLPPVPKNDSIDELLYAMVEQQRLTNQLLESIVANLADDIRTSRDTLEEIRDSFDTQSDTIIAQLDVLTGMSESMEE